MNKDNHDDVIDDNGLKQGFVTGSDDPAQYRSPSSRDKLRKQLMDEVNAFLARGGEIQQMEPMLGVDNGNPSVSAKLEVEWMQPD